MPVLSENLIAYYQCDAAAPAQDDWGSYTATLSSIGSQPGKFNESWEFSNSFDSVNTGSTPNVGTYTIAGWGYNIRAGWATLAANNAGGTSNHWYMAINTGTNELGVWSNSTFTGSGYTIVPASLTGWHHYAVTRDASGNVTFYIDGAQVGGVITPTMPGNFRVTFIGSEPGGADYRWAERIDDFAIWNRALDPSEIAVIHTEGNAGNSLRSLLGPSLLRGQFGAVLHSLTAQNARLEGQFGTVLHTAAPENARLEGQFGTVLHTTPTTDARLAGQFGAVLHNAPTPTAICPDITGFVGVPATFDGSASTAITYYRWSWVSVPGGSAVSNAAIPFPDNGATTPIDMTNNVGLWHFDTLNSASNPTGSIGLIDTFGDGWHGNNFVTVTVGGTAVLTNITLPSGSGPLWFNYAANTGDAVAVSFTGGSYPNECKYDLNDAAGGTGTTFYNSPTNPTVTYNFTAPAFTPLTSYSTPDTSGSGNTASVLGPTQVAGKVGTHALDFSSGDYLEVPNDASLNSAIGTVSLWIKTSTSTAGTHATLVAKNTTAASRQGFHLYIENNQIAAQLKDAGMLMTTIAPAGPLLNDGAWHHIAFVYASGGTSEIYVDGVLVSSSGTITFNITSAFPLRMGVNVDSFWGNYVGSMDEVAMWSRALSSAEIADIHLAQGGTLAGIGTSTFTFTPDIVGTYTINLAIDGSNNTNADCVVTVPSSGGGGTQGGNAQGGSLQGHRTQGLI